MRFMYADKQGASRVGAAAAEEIAALLKLEEGLLWVDLAGDEPGALYEQLLTDTFGFHPLAVDDALYEVHLPKVDNWDSYLYIVLQDVVLEKPEYELSLPELDCFVGKRYLVTYHLDPSPALERVWQLSQVHAHWLTHGADHLLYRLVDELANNYLQVVELLEDDLDDVEPLIFAQPRPETLEMLFNHKRLVLQLRRVLAPLRDVLSRLSREGDMVIGPRDRLFYRDVYDHMVRLFDLNEGLRDLVTSSIDVYLSVVNNRMNDVMKTLTLITTLFMPLTFLTGFFGMNFFSPVLDLEAWTGGFMFAVVLAAMVLVPAAMYAWMRHRAWMQSP